jgi:Mn2+/Fe2+ NRAMP family transporter
MFGSGRVAQLFIVAYLIVGALVANRHHYFAHLNTARQILSAALAVVAWPLILLGIDLHIRKKDF